MEVFVQNGTMYFGGIFSLLASVLGAVFVLMVLLRSRPPFPLLFRFLLLVSDVVGEMFEYLCSAWVSALVSSSFDGRTVTLVCSLRSLEYPMRSC